MTAFGVQLYPLLFLVMVVDGVVVLVVLCAARLRVCKIVMTYTHTYCTYMLVYSRFSLLVVCL